MPLEAAVPPDLDLILNFVNTHEIDERTDAIGTPDTLAAWLADRALADARDPFTADDVRQADAVREALRALLFHNNGEPLEASAVSTLSEVAAQAPLRVDFDGSGSARLEPARGAFAGVAARLLAAVARAQAEGTWSRLKACGASDCRWAYYDHSRNHSKHWCSMRVCGNRAKARSYRTRQKPA